MTFVCFLPGCPPSLVPLLKLLIKNFEVLERAIEHDCDIPDNIEGGHSDHRPSHVVLSKGLADERREAEQVVDGEDHTNFVEDL